jgi:hypothetical protein
MASKWVCILAVLLMASPAAAQVTSVIVPALPSLGSDSGKDPDAIYCRPPQDRTDSRTPGPKTCRTNRAWDELHAQGLDIGPDGKSIVASEKYRSVRGQ